MFFDSINSEIEALTKAPTYTSQYSGLQLTMNFLEMRRSGIYYILAVAITVGLVFIYDYLPKRHYMLLPNADAWAFSNDDGERGGNSEAQWLDNTFSHWRCTLREGVDIPSCAIGVALSRDPDDWTAGVDFSRFQAMIVHLDYEGPSRLIRIHIRNFDEQISSPDDYSSAKFNKINLRVSDLNEPVRIELNEFQLADWWISDYDIPRKWSQATFDRVTSFGLDFASPAPLGTHEVVIKRIEFVGVYLSHSTWYLLILNAWMLVILGSSIIRMRQLHLRSQRDKSRLKEMAAYAQSMKEKIKDFQEQSQIDILTGVYNRIGLQNIIDSVFERRRKNDGLSLIVLDLDHFKNVNDTYGHSQGDEVLKKIGELLTSITRNDDAVARWGGEEFIILCPATSPQEAFTLAEKIRLQIKQLEFADHPDLSISATFGISFVEFEDTFATAFSRADAAMYSGKNSGRDCSVISTTC